MWICGYAILIIKFQCCSIQTIYGAPEDEKRIWIEVVAKRSEFLDSVDNFCDRVKEKYLEWDITTEENGQTLFGGLSLSEAIRDVDEYTINNVSEFFIGRIQKSFNNHLLSKESHLAVEFFNQQRKAVEAVLSHNGVYPYESNWNNFVQIVADTRQKATEMIRNNNNRSWMVHNCHSAPHECHENAHEIHNYWSNWTIYRQKHVYGLYVPKGSYTVMQNMASAARREITEQFHKMIRKYPADWFIDGKNGEDLLPESSESREKDTGSLKSNASNEELASPTTQLAVAEGQSGAMKQHQRPNTTEAGTLVANSPFALDNPLSIFKHTSFPLFPRFLTKTVKRKRSSSTFKANINMQEMAKTIEAMSIQLRSVALRHDRMIQIFLIDTGVEQTTGIFVVLPNYVPLDEDQTTQIYDDNAEYVVLKNIFDKWKIQFYRAYELTQLYALECIRQWDASDPAYFRGIEALNEVLSSSSDGDLSFNRQSIISIIQRGSEIMEQAHDWNYRSVHD